MQNHGPMWMMRNMMITFKLPRLLRGAPAELDCLGGDDDDEEEHEHEEEVVHREPLMEKAPESPLPVKENEKQLSKKERKKKELEELQAIIADFGATPKDINGQGDAQEKKGVGLKTEETDDNEDNKEGGPSESKNSKKKKKKDNKSSKDSKETQEQVDENSTTVDVRERLEKVGVAKKKSGKELDGAAKAAAQEAAARTARLAAAKKKEKSHYNQDPKR